MPEHGVGIAPMNKQHMEIQVCDEHTFRNVVFICHGCVTLS